MSNEREIQILERLELRLDTLILMSTGMPQAEAEQRVYGPKFVELIAEIKDAARRIKQIERGAA